jgi:tRNA 2-thiouridine synthesizing protein B
MSSLHTWNKAEAQAEALALCLATLAPGDALLLLEDAVYLTDATGIAALRAKMTHPDATSLYALAPDLAARGISARISPLVHVVEYPDFVALSLQHARVVSWT